MGSNRNVISKIIKIKTHDIIKESLTEGKNIDKIIEEKIVENGIDISKSFEVYFDNKKNQYIIIQ